MTEIRDLRALVRRIVEHLGDQEAAPFEEPIQRGSATGRVALLDDPDDDLPGVLMVRLALMRAPRDPDFYLHLLRLNHQYLGRAAFSIGPDGVVSVTAGRPVEDLDPSEVIDLLLWTSELADEWDDRLLDEYGRELAL